MSLSRPRALAATLAFAASSGALAHTTQGGFASPDRDYYLRTDAKSKELLAKYRAHVARMRSAIRS